MKIKRLTMDQQWKHSTDIFMEKGWNQIFSSNLLIYLRGDSAVSCLTMASRLTCLVLYKGFQIVRFACVELVGQALVLFIFNFFLRKFFYFLFVAICRLLLLLRTKAHFRSRLQFSVLQDGNHYSIRMRLY